MAIANKDATVLTQYAQSGAFPRYAIKFNNCNNDGGSYTLNPFGEDMVILEAYLDVETVDTTSGTIDVGLDDDILGTMASPTIFTEHVCNAEGIFQGLAVNVVVTNVVRPIWKKSGNASYLVIHEGATGGTGDADFNILLVVAREADFE